MVFFWNGYTSWEWQIGRLYWTVLKPRFWSSSKWKIVTIGWEID